MGRPVQQVRAGHRQRDPIRRRTQSLLGLPIPRHCSRCPPHSAVGLPASGRRTIPGEDLATLLLRRWLLRSCIPAQVLVLRPAWQGSRSCAMRAICRWSTEMGHYQHESVASCPESRLMRYLARLWTLALREKEPRPTVAAPAGRCLPARRPVLIEQPKPH
jgi:hypothetical protein